MDNAERSGRVELAAAFRLAVRFGFHEGIDNHFSLALTDDGREFLVNPYGRHFGELRARDLLRVDTDGRVLAGDGEVEPTALYIHGQMHAARPDAPLHPPHPHALRHRADLGRGRPPRAHQPERAPLHRRDRLRRRLRRPRPRRRGGRAPGRRCSATSASCSWPTTASRPPAPASPRPSTTSTSSSAPARTRSSRMSTGRPLKPVPGRRGRPHPAPVRPLRGPRRAPLRRAQAHPRPRRARLRGVSRRAAPGSRRCAGRRLLCSAPPPGS